MKHKPRHAIGRTARAWDRISTSTFIVGLLSLVWLAFRTGTKPSRAAYPCQRLAAANSATWLATYILPALSITGFIGENRSWRRKLATVALMLVVSFGAAWIVNGPGLLGVAATGPVNLVLEAARASASPASDVLVIDGTVGDDGGIARLISLMAQHGTALYRSDTVGPARGPQGLIAQDAVVLIKINAQWDQRGGTNTDLLRSLVEAIVNHPDGFTGEVIVADNGQAQYGSTGSGGSMDWDWNNAEDRSQSTQDVVDALAETHRVSTFLWDRITRTQAAEYEAGDLDDGYIVAATRSSSTGALVAYPKFRTSYGTYVSFKRGIWDPARKTYDSKRLVVINVPVLKPHMIFGVTGCIKHYMGVTSDYLTRSAGARAHDSVGTGGMGTLIAETRLPDLNILDATYVSLAPGAGPQVRYAHATEIGVIAASTDPVALDYWGAKYILTQGARARGVRDTRSLDPESRRSFATWLRLSMAELAAAGHQVTVDETRMNIYVQALAGP